MTTSWLSPGPTVRAVPQDQEVARNRVASLFAGVLLGVEQR